MMERVLGPLPKHMIVRAEYVSFGMLHIQDEAANEFQIRLTDYWYALINAVLQPTSWKVLQTWIKVRLAGGGSITRKYEGSMETASPAGSMPYELIFYS